MGRVVDIENFFNFYLRNGHFKMSIVAPLTGGGEPGLNLDVIIAGSLDLIHSHHLDQFFK